MDRERVVKGVGCVPCDAEESPLSLVIIRVEFDGRFYFTVNGQINEKVP